MTSCPTRSAVEVAGAVVDPELPMLTVADLGVLRSVRHEGGRVVVAITPTYSACPALATMRTGIERALQLAGWADVEVRTVLDPAWTSDWITPAGRRKLAEAGIAPPGAAPLRAPGPVPVTLRPASAPVACPQCGSHDTVELSAFSATSCRALHRCRACREPFERFKEL